VFGVTTLTQLNRRAKRKKGLELHPLVFSLLQVRSSLIFNCGIHVKF